MKKIVFLLFLLIVFKAEAQKSAVFKMKYKPGNKYGSSEAIAVNLKVAMTGNDAILEKLSDQGITMPVSIDGSVNIKGDIDVGKKGDANSFPFAAFYSAEGLKIEINGKPIDPLKGKTLTIKMYAHGDADGKIKADSSVFNDKTDTSQSSLSQILRTVLGEIKFPERRLKIGESFDIDAPMNIPMRSGAGYEVNNVNTKNIYTLTAITDGKAYFDVNLTGNIDLTAKTTNVVIVITGAGKLVYSMKDNFPLSFSNKLAMKVNITAGTMVIEGNADITVDKKNTIN